MKNWLQATQKRGRIRSQLARLPASKIPFLLGLGAWLVWTPLPVSAEVFAINPIPNRTVLVGTLVEFDVSVENTTLGTSDLNWSLNSNPATTASLSPPLTGRVGPTTFSWRPTRAGTVTFAISVSQLDTLNQTNTIFTITATNREPSATPPSLSPIANRTVNADALLQFSLFATNTDNTTNLITFALESDPPSSAEITNSAMSLIKTSSSTNGVFEGVFHWTPDETGLYEMSVTAVETVDESTTIESLPRTFTVNVILNPDCPDYGQFLMAVEQGGLAELSDCPTLVLSNAVVITNDVTIVGVGEEPVIITGNNLTRMFTVREGGSLTLSNLTLEAGLGASGGAIRVKKGGRVFATDCTFKRNVAAGANGQSGTAGDASDPNYGGSGGPGLFGLPGLGGAICNSGYLEVHGCQFLENRAIGGHGGDGGDGAGGSYQGGNGGKAGDGAIAFGGAIYNLGTLVVSNCAFLGNTATAGSGGDGGAAGGGVFVGYAGSGGAGAYAGGGAICSGPNATVEACVFSGNTAQGGSSQTGGTAGGGYGVSGAPGGTGFGGAVCLTGGGALADCQFVTNSAVGGNGGGGGGGLYGGGNGGNGGDGLGGCLWNSGPVAVVNCTFAACDGVSGTNGAGGGGPFSGRSGFLGRAISNRINDALSPFTIANSVVAPTLPNGPNPMLVDPANMLVAAAQTAGGAIPAEALASAAAATSALVPTAASASNAPAAIPGSPAAVPGANPSGAPAGLPTTAIAPSPRPGAATAPLPGQTNAVPGQPAAAKAPGDEPLPQGMIDFRGADLNQVLEIYSLLVNRTLLRPATLPAPTIVLTTQGQLTMKEGIQALEAVLALNGITMVNVGDKFVKVVAEAQSGSAAAAFNTNSAAQLPDLGQYVTHVVQLKYAKPSELVPVLTPFVKIPNGILPLDPNQILVLRDYSENVKRMLEMVERIDVAVPSEFVQEVIPIKYAQASEIASALNSLSAGGGGASIGGSTGGGGTTSGRTMGSRMGGGMGSGMGRSGSFGGMGGYQGGMMGSSPFGQSGYNPQATTGQAGTGSSFTQRLQNIISRASSVTGDIQVIGQTKIIADERTNSLLIFASREDMKVIKEIVSKLDVVLAQVLIESVIIEVTLTDSHDLGVSYLQHPQNIGNWTGVGALNNKTFRQASDYASGGTNASGIIPGGFSYLMSFGQDLDVAVAAAAADSRAKILQRPRLQTSHNEPAALFVGETRPYPTSSYYGGGGYGGYSSIQQLQIGVTLDITPLINPDGLVVLEIHQKIDAFAGNVSIQNVGDVPITSSKEAQAKVAVRDHDTIILGGLIETDKNKNKSGVPFLMDIPMLGYLFRSTHADEVRKEFIVLIRPTVLPTPEIAALTATAEKNKMPGVRATEKELRGDEIRRLKQAGSDEPIFFEPVRPQ